MKKGPEFREYGGIAWISERNSLAKQYLERYREMEPGNYPSGSVWPLLGPRVVLCMRGIELARLTFAVAYLPQQLWG